MTFDRITRDPRQMGGKPCIRGTGITVGRIFGQLAGGTTRRELLAAYPALEPADIEEVLGFIKQQLRDRELPDLEHRGQTLTAPALADYHAPDPASERLETLIRREKASGVSAEERMEIDDFLRLDHLLTLAKAVARIHLMAAAG